MLNNYVNQKCVLVQYLLFQSLFFRSDLFWTISLKLMNIKLILILWKWNILECPLCSWETCKSPFELFCAFNFVLIFVHWIWIKDCGWYCNHRHADCSCLGGRNKGEERDIWICTDLCHVLKSLINLTLNLNLNYGCTNVKPIVATQVLFYCDLF